MKRTMKVIEGGAHDFGPRPPVRFRTLTLPVDCTDEDVSEQVAKIQNSITRVGKINAGGGLVLFIGKRRVTWSGSFHRAGRPSVKKIGPWPDIRLRDARAKAREIWLAAGRDDFLDLPKQAWLRIHELRRVLHDLPDLPAADGHYLQFLVATGCFGTEAQQLRLCDLDRENMIIRATPENQAILPVNIHLGQIAMAAVESAIGDRRDPNSLIFYGDPAALRGHPKSVAEWLNQRTEARATHHRDADWVPIKNLRESFCRLGMELGLDIAAVAGCTLRPNCAGWRGGDPFGSEDEDRRETWFGWDAILRAIIDGAEDEELRGIGELYGRLVERGRADRRAEGARP